METTQDIRYSLIVPTRNRATILKDFLDNLRVQKFTPGQWEILIVDNASEDDTSSVVRGFRKKCPDIPVHYLFEGRIGMMHARNSGIEKARGEFLIFMDDDVLPEQHFTENAERILPAIEGPFAGGGKIIPVFEHQKPPWMIRFFMPLLAEVNLGESFRPFPKNRFPFGINMVVRRNVLNRTGLFDTSAGPRSEEWINLPEQSFFRRVRDAGIPVYYFPDLTVWHFLPPQYTDRAHIRRQAEIHYRMRLSEIRRAGRQKKLRFLFQETGKWIVSLGISLYYLLSTQWEKIKPLFQYRYWTARLLWRCARGKDHCE